MLKFQSAIEVVSKFNGSYVAKAGDKAGQTINTYGIVTLDDGRAENIEVSVDVWGKVEKGKTYIVSGAYGVTKYGKYWTIEDVLKEVKEKDKE